MKKKIFLVVTALLLLVTTGCSWFKSKSNDYLNGTSWKDKYDSEMVFNDGKYYWYQLSTEHNDNYFAGPYKVYKGGEAVIYVATGDLESKGLTTEKLNKMFNSTYKEENLIIIIMDIDKYLLKGVEQTIDNNKRYYFGFLADDGSVMDITNLDNYSRYTFTKQ